MPTKDPNPPQLHPDEFPRARILDREGFVERFREATRLSMTIKDSCRYAGCDVQIYYVWREYAEESREKELPENQYTAFFDMIDEAKSDRIMNNLSRMRELADSHNFPAVKYLLARDGYAEDLNVKVDQGSGPWVLHFDAEDDNA